MYHCNLSILHFSFKYNLFSIFFMVSLVGIDLSIGAFLLSGETPLFIGKKKTSLVIGGNHTQLLADRMATAACALHHCTT